MGRRDVVLVNIKSFAAVSCSVFSGVRQLFLFPEFWVIIDKSGLLLDLPTYMLGTMCRGPDVAEGGGGQHIL